MKAARAKSLAAAAILLLTAVGTVQADPRLWGEAGHPLRLGRHLNWRQTAARDDQGWTCVVWSDTRAQSPDVYAQLFNAEGEELWPAGGVPVVVEPHSQTDPAICAVDGGFIIAWIDTRNDFLGDVYAQKLSYGGTPLWTADNGTGVPVDTESEFELYYPVPLQIERAEGEGGAIIVWGDRRLDPGDLWARRITADGTLAWPGPLPVCTAPNEQREFVSTVIPGGGLLLAWTDRRANNNDVYAALVTAEGTLPWGENGLLLCTAPGSQDHPQITADGSDGCYVAWVDNRNDLTGDLYMQRLNADGQAQWIADGVPFCDAPDQQRDVQLATSRAGSVTDGCLAVWEDFRRNSYDPEVYAQKLSPVGMALWNTGGLRLAGFASDDPNHPSGIAAFAPAVASDGLGGLIGVWEDTHNGTYPENSDLWGVRVFATGQLGWAGVGGNLILDGPSRESRPWISVHGSDVLILCQGDSYLSPALYRQHIDLISGARQIDPASTRFAPGLRGSASDVQTVSMAAGRTGLVWEDFRLGYQGPVLYYQVLNAAGQPERAPDGECLSPDHEGTSRYDQQYPRLCQDGAGGFFAVWEDLRTGEKRLRFTHVNAAGERVGPAAGREIWSDPETVDQQSAFIALDGLGGCYLAWSNLNNEYVFDAYVLRLNDAGEPTWDQPVRLTDNDDDDIIYGLASDPDVCCTVVWRSGNFPEFDISGATVCADGAVAWSGFICNAPGTQENPAVISDGQHGTYIAWEDARTPASQQNIYAQHLSPQGNWPENGLLVNGDTLSQRRPQLAVDRAGNLLVVWEDFRSDNDLDLYAQKLGPAGALLWEAAGRPISVAPRDQERHRVLHDGEDGWLVGWVDRRSTIYYGTVYGLHLTPDGQIQNDDFWQPDGSPLGDPQRRQEDCLLAPISAGALVVWQEDHLQEPEDWEWDLQMQRLDLGVAGAGESPAALPDVAALHACYPNPFNPSTTIAFDLPQAAQVKLTVFDLLGREVAVLADQRMAAGSHHLRFDGAALSSGVYFYRLDAGAFSDTRKMLLLK